MLTYLYPSSPQNETKKKKKGLWIMLRCRVHMSACLWQAISKVRTWSFDLSDAVWSSVSTFLFLKMMHMSSRVNTRNQKVLKVNITWNVALFSEKKKNWAITWLFDLSLSPRGVFLSVCFCRRRLRCLASLVCTQSVCDYCPLQAPCTVMRLFTKQLHLHRFCQEPLKS